MKKLLMYPFNVAIQELKKDNQLRKTQKYKRSNVKLFPIMAFSCMFLFIMSCMYVGILYLVIVSTFLDPKSFIAVPMEILVTLVFTLTYTKVFPKTKKNYLKTMGLYSEDK